MAIIGSGRAGRFFRCCPVYIVILLGLSLVAAVIATTLVTKKMADPLYTIRPPDVHFKYTNMNGYFLQDEASTNPSNFDYSTTNMGLINRTYPTDASFDPNGKKTQWERFENYVRYLKSTAKDGESYKVLYLGRHGEGWHNVEEANVGGHLWDCYWSRLDGDGKIVWANAALTPLGIQQALKANTFWKTGLNSAKIPAPESYYVSPLQRTLLTSNYTFTGLSLPPAYQYKPVIKELLREALGIHTCDRRDTKSKIASLWPSYTFEPNFPEQDPLWDPDYRESGGQQVHRLQLFLDDIFNTDTNIFISCTSHSGSISSVQQGVGHRQFQLNTGAIIPIFLKAQRQKGPRPEGKIDPPVKSPTCPAPPGA